VRNRRLLFLVEGAVMIALSTVLSMVKLWSLPQGGSVTAASMVPILIFALRWGGKGGLFAAVVYGILQGIIEPFIVHPIQYLLDYPIAFGLLGITGFFNKNLRIAAFGTVIALLGRYLSHVLSGVVFFASYAPQGMNPLVYSMVYNSFVLVELLYTLPLTLILWNVISKALPDIKN